MADFLEQSLEMLTVFYRNLPPRQRSIEATMEWSFNFVTERKRLVLISLCVFRGVFFCRRCSRITSGYSGRNGAFSSSFPSRPLSGASPDNHRHPAILLANSVRKFCENRAQERGLSSDFDDRHIRWFAEFVEHQSKRVHSADQLQALLALATEWPHIQKAFRGSVASARWPRVAFLARSLLDVLDIRGL
ncbi:MAG: hypothetical protein V2G42_06440 [bacterium JZ-2024 1]